MVSLRRVRFNNILISTNSRILTIQFASFGFAEKLLLISVVKHTNVQDLWNPLAKISRKIKKINDAEIVSMVILILFLLRRHGT